MILYYIYIYICTKFNYNGEIYKYLAVTKSLMKEKYIGVYKYIKFRSGLFVQDVQYLWFRGLRQSCCKSFVWAVSMSLLSCQSPIPILSLLPLHSRTREIFEFYHCFSFSSFQNSISHLFVYYRWNRSIFNKINKIFSPYKFLSDN